MTFASPLWLLGLLALPLLAWTARRKGRRPGLSFSATDDAALLPPTFGTRWAGLPSALRLAALGLGVVALARPQQRDRIVDREAEGIDIVLALDASTSMLADDFYPNRFEAAKAVAVEFVRGRTSDRIGLVVFAAQAYTQAPLTLDYEFLQAMLADVRIGLIEDGTAIGSGLATATARLHEGVGRSRVVILLTDGQNNRGEVDPATAAEAAAALGVRAYTIGVGSDEERRRPFGDPFGPPPAQIDEATLRHVAAATGGRYFRATDADALRAVYAAIGELETAPVEAPVYVDVEERYAWFLWPAFLLLCLDVTLASTRLRRVP